MRSASSFRRSAGLLAAATVAFSTTVLLGPGTAQAVGSGWVFSSGDGPSVTVPEGTCAIDWRIIGGWGGTDDLDGAVNPGIEQSVRTEVAPGDTFTLAPGTAGGSSADGSLGGTNTSGSGAYDGEDGLTGSGGGGAASVVLVGSSVYLAAGGGGGLGPDGGDPGSATESGDALLIGGHPNEFLGVTESGAGPDGLIQGTGIACEVAEQGPPVAPQNLLVVGDDGFLNVHFEPGYAEDATDADTFEYSLDAGETWTEAGIHQSWDSLAFNIEGLENGTEYDGLLRGVDIDANPGATAAFTGTPYKWIGKPGNVEVSTAASQVTVTWDAPTVEGTYALDGFEAVLSPNYGESGGGDLFVCETAVDELGCEMPVAPGVNYDVFVYAIDEAGNNGTVAGPFATGVVAPPATVPASNGTITAPAGTDNGVAKGEKVTISGSGYAPNTLVSILIYSEPQVLTTVMTDGTGSFTVEVTVPAGLAVGNHTLVAAGLDPSGVMRYLTLPVLVTADGATLADTGADVTAPALGGLAAVVVGAGLLVAARRRPEPAAATPGTDLTD